MTTSPLQKRNKYDTHLGHIMKYFKCKSIDGETLFAVEVEDNGFAYAAIELLKAGGSFPIEEFDPQVKQSSDKPDREN
jgi:hypothetical protein